jgi:hypothetical protein
MKMIQARFETLLTTALCVVVFATGCSTRGKYDIPSGAIPQPNGTYVRLHTERQANNAEASDFIMFMHEWTPDSVSLGPYGQRHLLQMTARLVSEQYSIIIEPSTDPALDERRRAAVAKHLLENQIPDAENRVLVSVPTAEGIFAEESTRIFKGALNP